MVSSIAMRLPPLVLEALADKKQTPPLGRHPWEGGGQPSQVSLPNQLLFQSERRGTNCNSSQHCSPGLVLPARHLPPAAGVLASRTRARTVTVRDHALSR